MTLCWQTCKNENSRRYLRHSNQRTGANTGFQDNFYLLFNNKIYNFFMIRLMKVFFRFSITLDWRLEAAVCESKSPNEYFIFG